MPAPPPKGPLVYQSRLSFLLKLELLGDVDFCVVECQQHLFVAVLGVGELFVVHQDLGLKEQQQTYHCQLWCLLNPLALPFRDAKAL